ncbi:ABC-2 transporter permease [Acidobacteriota bacterium]
MLNIMKRNANFFALYLIFVIVLVGIMAIIMHNELKVAFVIISGVLVILQVVGGTFVNEQYEEKHKGYAFLSILPVKEEAIVAAKFLLALITNVLFVGFLVFLFSLSPSPPEEIALAQSYVLFMGAICLAMAGLSYAGIFSIGYTKFAVIVMSFLVALGLLPMLLMKAYKDRMDVLVDQLLEFFAGLNWLAIIPIALIVYFGLMAIAVKIKSNRSFV